MSACIKLNRASLNLHAKSFMQDSKLFSASVKSNDPQVCVIKDNSEGGKDGYFGVNMAAEQER